MTTANEALQLTAAKQPVPTMAEIAAQLRKTLAVDAGYKEALMLKRRIVAVQGQSSGTAMGALLAAAEGDSSNSSANPDAGVRVA